MLFFFFLQIDFLNVQFYNQGANYYDYNSIYVNSGNTFPDSAVSDYPEAMQKVTLLGKPMLPQYAGNGYNTSSQINTINRQAQSSGYYHGVMTWEFPNQQPNVKSFLASWVQTVTSGV